MTVENVIATILSVEYLFGAATALAFRKQVSSLFDSIFSRAEGNGDES